MAENDKAEVSPETPAVKATNASMFDLGPEDAALILRDGGQIEIVMPDTGDDKVNQQTLLAVGLMRLIDTDPKIIMGAIDDVENMCAELEDAARTPCPNCGETKAIKLVAEHKDKWGWVCGECHEGWDTNSKGVLIRQDTTQLQDDLEGRN